MDILSTLKQYKKDNNDNSFINTVLRLNNIPDKDIECRLKFYIDIMASLDFSNNYDYYCKCRSHEEGRIAKFFFNNLNEEIPIMSNSFIIYGQPGIGKTHLITKIIQELKLIVNNKPIPESERILNLPKITKNIIFIEVNAMNFDNCMSFLKTIFMIIIKNDDLRSEINQSNNYEVIFELLKKHISDVLETNYIMVFIDELDFLKKSDCRNFGAVVDFLNFKKQGFFKICVSNTFDLFGNYNNRKNELKYSTLAFKPYSDIDLKEIMIHRLMKCYNTIENKNNIDINDIFDKEHTTLISKKIYKNGSNDVRKAFNILKSVFEKNLIDVLNNDYNNIITNKKIGVTFECVMDVVNNYFNDKRPDIYASLSNYTKLLLLSIYDCTDSINLEINIEKIKSKFNCLLNNIGSDEKIDINILLNQLKDYNFIEYKKNKGKEIIESSLIKEELEPILKNCPFVGKYF